MNLLEKGRVRGHLLVEKFDAEGKLYDTVVGSSGIAIEKRLAPHVLQQQALMAIGVF